MPSENTASKGRILIVEDEALISMLLETTLMDAGYDVVGIADSVPQALEMLDQSMPDIAILDLNLRGLKVYPVADRLAGAGIPFIFATGGGTTVEAFGDRPKIQKPYREEDLLAQIETALA